MKIVCLTCNELTRIIEKVVEQQLNSFKLKIENREYNKKEETCYITREVAAKELNCSINTLDKWLNEGLLKSYRIGRKILLKKTEVLNTPNERFKKINKLRNVR